MEYDQRRIPLAAPSAVSHRTSILIQALVLALLSLGVYHLGGTSMGVSADASPGIEQAPGALQVSDLRYLVGP